MNFVVDCDDTLVIWEDEVLRPHPFGNGAERWTPNRDLIELLRILYTDGHMIMIWSGGGLDYARRWRLKLVPFVQQDGGKSRDWLFPPDTVFIDDMQIKGYVGDREVIHPDAFIDEWQVHIMRLEC